jgi:hypothetical protein
MRRLAYTIALTLYASVTVSPTNGLAVSVEEWSKYSDVKRAAYLTGVYDAWKQGQRMFFDDEDKGTGLSRFAHCTKVMNPDQFANVVDSFIKERQEEVWQMEMALVASLATDRICPSELRRH